MTHFDYSAADICKVIKVCKECGVSRFALNGITIEFIGTETREATEGGHVAPFSVEQQPPLRDRAKDKKREFEELLSEAMLADPNLYEELLEIGEKDNGMEEDFRPERDVSRSGVGGS